MAGYNRESLIQKIAEIRVFEQTLLELFPTGKLYGTTHTCIGQEACAAGLAVHLDPAIDIAFSNHRGHGHFLAFGGSPDELLAEIMGKKGGTCNGRGGSQHLCKGFFFSQGVQGQSVPIAVGCAYKKKVFKEAGIVAVHIGDGTLGQGVLYESLNIASLLSVPLLVVVEFNGVAQSTPTERTIAGDLIMRFEGFGVKVDRRKVNDPFEIADHFGEAVEYVRSGKPFVQILDTFRLMAHSKGDDDRPAELVAAAWSRDWLSNRLAQQDPVAVAAWAGAKRSMAETVARAGAAPDAEFGDPSVFAPREAPPFRSSADLLVPEPQTELRINELLNRALDELLLEEPGVQLIGEDIADHYGGAFKVTRGLSTKYPGRIFSTPISEAAIAGIGNGWALQNGYPIVEIMFGDFVTLAAEQLVNQAAKMWFMYNGKVTVPLTVRLVSGGYRGYGATHSQSLESLFCGVPGLKVVALSRRHNVVPLLKAAVLDPNPVIFVENKTLYAQKPLRAPPPGFRFVALEPEGADEYPPLLFTSTDPGESAEITIVTYGGMTDMVEEVMTTLLVQEEIGCDYFVLTELSAERVDAIAASVSRTGRLVVVEEGYVSLGIGAGIVAKVAEALPRCEFQVRRAGAMGVPIPPARHLEIAVLPSVSRIQAAILEIID